MAFNSGSAFGAQTGSLFGSAAPLFGASPPASQQRPAFGAGAPGGAGGGGGGGLFGAAPGSAFGASTASFGAPASAFGAPTSAFGAAAAPTPAFGQQQQQQPSAFGSSVFGGGGSLSQQQTGAGLFGSGSTSLFGGQTQPSGSLFGAQASQPTVFGGGGTFGQQPTSVFGGGGMAGSSSAFGASANPSASGGLFGAPAATGSGSGLFGQPSRPSVFGAAPSGGSGLFGSSTGGAQGGGLFGQQPATASAFGGGGAFGAAVPSTGGLFGASSSLAGAGVPGRGTAGVKWAISVEQEGNPPQQSKYNSVTMMPGFKDRSVEELRWEDYAGGNHLSTTAQGATAGSGGLFGSNVPTGTTTGGLFGQTAPPQHTFGGPSSSSAIGGFGSTTTGIGAVPSTGLFGASAQPSTAGFGSSLFGASSAPAFGTSAPSGLFGAAQPGSFGQTASGSLFGSGSSGAGFGGTSGGSSLFGGGGSQSAGAFSQPSGFGGTSASQPSLFGSSQPGSLFGGGGTAQSQASLFGTPGPSSHGSLFGSAAPLGTVQSSSVFGEGSLFGASNATPSSGGQTSIFGGSFGSGGFGAGGSGSSTPGLSLGGGITATQGAGFGGFGALGVGQSGSSLGAFGSSSGAGFGSAFHSHGAGSLFRSGPTGFGTSPPSMFGGGSLTGGQLWGAQPTTGGAIPGVASAGWPGTTGPQQVGSTALPPLVASLDVNPFGTSALFAGAPGVDISAIGKDAPGFSAVACLRPGNGGMLASAYRGPRPMSAMRRNAQSRLHTRSKVAGPQHTNSLSLYESNPPGTPTFGSLGNPYRTVGDSYATLTTPTRGSRFGVVPRTNAGTRAPLHAASSGLSDRPLYQSSSRASTIKKLVIRPLLWSEAAEGDVSVDGRPVPRKVVEDSFVEATPNATRPSVDEDGHDESGSRGLDDHQSEALICPTPVRPGKDHIPASLQKTSHPALQNTDLKSEEGDPAGTEEEDIRDGTDDDDEANVADKSANGFKEESRYQSDWESGAVIAINASAPRSSRAGVFTRPSMQELAAMDDEGLAHVVDFSVGVEDVGEVQWPGETDVRGLDLDKDVSIKPREVVVYAQDETRPPVGHGLNKRALVRLHGLWKTDKATKQPIKNASTAAVMVKKLKAHCEAEDLIFLGYDISTGTWTFETSHF